MNRWAGPSFASGHTTVLAWSPTLFKTACQPFDRGSARVSSTGTDAIIDGMNDVGRHFEYRRAGRLFSGRDGEGPLEIVWDTNILLDYLSHGRQMWDGELLKDDGSDYSAELQGLQLIVELWTRRDLRFHILGRTLTDARQRLENDRIVARRHAIDEVAAALQLDMWASVEDPPPAPYPSRATTIAAAVRRVPSGADRDLIAQAIAFGMHVFLTRDKGLLRLSAELSPCGLWVASPLDLLEDLAACGGLDALLDPRSMWWPAPDLQRVSHLIRALSPEPLCVG